MASVIDSFKEVFSENLSFLKMIALALPIYYSYQVYAHSSNDFTGFWGIAILTGFFLFGFIIEITNNVINERNNVLPPLNPMLIAFSSLKGIIALGLVILISSLLANYICSTINTVEWLNITLKTIVWIAASSFIGVSFLMFAAKEKITDAFKLKTLFQKVVDFMIVLIFFIIQLLFLNILITGFIGYTLFILLGFGVVFDIFMSIALVYNLAILGHYMGQAYYELIGFQN